MPTYTFKTKTGKIVEHAMSIVAYDAFKLSHPELVRFFETAPAFTMDGKTMGSTIKTDGGFKEVLSKIGSKYPGSPLDGEMNGKSTKRVKTEQSVKKSREKAIKRLQGR